MKILMAIICLFSSDLVFSQHHKTENLIIVTLDGMRWQEVFGGIDSQIVVNKKFTRDSAFVVDQFWRNRQKSKEGKTFSISVEYHWQRKGSYMVTG